MANPTKVWDRIPVWGWYFKAGEVPCAGKLQFSIADRVNLLDGNAIYPKGMVIETIIGDPDSQDATVRSMVRQAMRDYYEDLDEMPNVAGAFDGTAWDVWWDARLPAAVFTSWYAADDPNIVGGAEAPYQVKVKEILSGGPQGQEYYIQPLLADLDRDVPGVNLGLVDVPPGSPTVPAPIYQKGYPGGVASLDDTGKVPVDQLPDDIGGGLDEAALEAYLAANPPSADVVVESSTKKVLTAAERTKLTALPDNATLTTTLAAKAADASVIHTTGAETKAGVLTFGSIPVLPASDPTTSNQATRKSYVDAAITAAVAGVINSAPGALDTLAELAAAFGDDANFSTTVTNALALKAPLASPTFTGTVTVPAPSGSTDASTKGYVDTATAATTARGSASITTAGNTNVAASAGNRHYEVGVAVSAFVGTATIALQSTNAQAGDRRSIRIQQADDAGTIEVRSLTSGGTLLATIPPNGTGATLGFQIMSTYSGSAWSVGAVIPEDLLDRLGGIDTILADLPTNYVTTAGLAAAVATAFADLLETAPYKYLATLWILESTEDETDLPGDFPTAPIVTGGPDPLILKRES